MPIPFRFAAFITTLVTLCSFGLAARAATDTDLVKKGEYLATAGDCIACHTAPGGKPFAGGLALKTPLGDIFTPNLTADKETGIGNWTDDQFYRAMHEGIGHGGEYLYPAFPFPWYTTVTKDDVLAIKAYLFSLPPEHAPRKANSLGFPFNVREGLITWRSLFFKAKDFAADPKQSEKVNRGAYLVEGLGHCGECHNHNNLLGASDWSGKLEGGEIQGWYAPNITSDGKQGVGSWDEDQIATYLKTGATPGKSIAQGPMMETIRDSLSHLTDDDLHAMGAYLKAAAAKEGFKPTTANQAAATQTAGIQPYLTNCSSCHRPDGKGIEGAIPALVGNGAVTAQGPENVIRAVLGGIAAGHGLAPMPAVGQGMTDAEIADVTNYVRTAWGNAAPANAATGMVGELRKDTHTLMTGGEGGRCTPVTDQALAQTIATAGVADQIKGMNQTNMLQRIDAFAPKLKSGADAAKRDDLVNALIATYCPIAMSDPSIAASDRTVLLGNFGGLVYGRLRSDAAAK